MRTKTDTALIIWSVMLIKALRYRYSIKLNIFKLFLFYCYSHKNCFCVKGNAIVWLFMYFMEQNKQSNKKCAA